ncbi:Cilia- and flagella-associated protein 99 [Oryzias melastigma]|uniref:Cilia- and flagella-associated protein 99 n=1 Tax=Oryzias melastigma TaxID=30732 RepID=A0A834FFF2_ORYME|nr:Cilia- and flagella-associated protein 99 [Oryzias melastigma]
MNPNYGSLVKKAIGLLDNFESKRQSLDAFLEEALQNLQDTDTQQRKFILNIVSECIEQKKLLDVVVNAFYGTTGKLMSRRDRNQFVIICYLTLSLDDLGLQNFCNIIKSIGTKNICMFLNFYLSNLTSWIKEEWSCIIDAAFVEEYWINPLLRWRPEIYKLLSLLAAKTCQDNQKMKVTSKVTVPQEFSFSKPKPRLPSMPELNQEQEKPKPAGSFLVKLNKAAILRREALCDQQLEQELQRQEWLMQGGLEPSAFLQWQREMLTRDKLPMTEKKQLEAQIRDERIALAREQITDRNQKTAQQTKEEICQLMQEIAEERIQEEQKKKDLVQQVAETHKNSKEAKEKLKKFKQTIVKEVSEESQELLFQALEEKQAELCKRFEMIHEIHTKESQPRVRLNQFDDTKTAGHGLLEEMPLAELRLRLDLLKVERQTEEQERRMQILQEKQKQEELLQKRLEAIELHSRALAEAAAISRRTEKQAREELLQQSLDKDETVLALRKELEQTKQARQQLKQAKKSKAKAHSATPMGTASQAGFKEKKWEELEQSLSRFIQNTFVEKS